MVAERREKEWDKEVCQQPWLAWISYKVFYTKSAINQRACAISLLDQPSQRLLRLRHDNSDKEFIIKTLDDRLWALGRYNVDHR